MKCPSCGNTSFERIDYSIVQCTECLSVWNPFIFQGFSEMDVNIGEIWDTEEDDLDDWDDLYEDEEDEWEELDEDDEEEDY